MQSDESSGPSRSENGPASRSIAVNTIQSRILTPMLKPTAVSGVSATADPSHDEPSRSTDAASTPSTSPRGIAAGVAGSESWSTP